MSRPTTKEDLIQLSNQNFEKMWNVIDSYSEKTFNTTFNFPQDLCEKAVHRKRDKNVRDVLIHLYERHSLLLYWIECNMQGNPSDFLPKPYTWKNYAELNIKFWEKHQKTSYDQSVIMLKKSHTEVMNVIQLFSDVELFTKKHFDWTGTTSLGSYCVSATSSHYDWAIKKLRKHQRLFF